MHNDLNSEALSLSLSELDYDFAGSTPAGIASRTRVGSVPASLFRYRAVKRGVDLALVLLSVPVWLPVVLLVAATVSMTSRGTVFYPHRRICRNGSTFSMWKFRTMHPDSAAVLEQHLAACPEARMEWERTHKLQSDPRVTSAGRFLRRFSLDELPQIWNVLCGQMSLVGPRPIVAAEVERYADRFKYYCQVKPGVTGLWQVSGRSMLTYDERVELDCRYVRDWSLMRDARILLLTFRTVVRQHGAY